MKKLFLALALLIAPNLFGQAWSGTIDASRAYDWTQVPGTIPTYSVLCSTQPTLSAAGGQAANNTTAINNAIASCDATHNVVKLPAGTYHTNGWTYGSKSNVVVRGASTSTDGFTGTYIYTDASTGACGGYGAVHICGAGNSLYAQSAAVVPGAGNNVCSITGGYTQNSTSITINSCGNGAPPVGRIIVLDQADDGPDTGGVFLCSTFNSVVNCTQKGNGTQQNAFGRTLSASGGSCNSTTIPCVQYSQQWITKAAAVSGSGPWTVTLADPIPFNNMRSGQTPGIWWPTSQSSNIGIENMTIDQTPDISTNIGILGIWVDGFWMQGVRSIGGAVVNHVDLITDRKPIIQNNYFYGSNHNGSSSYCVQMAEVSSGLVQNNIMQNTTSPDIKDDVTGSVTAYNFTPYINFGNISFVYLQGLYASHNSGSAFNLLEGNASTSAIGDDLWGTSYAITMFRNHFIGWQTVSGNTWTSQTNGLILNSGVRIGNAWGNVFGQPGYHTQYEIYADSTTTVSHTNTAGGSPVSGAGNVALSIYEMGTSDNSGLGNCATPPTCDSLVHNTLFRWNNYDVINGIVTNSAEATPGAVFGVNANLLPGSTSVPNSLYLTSKPGWFGSLTWPPYGPDVSGGNVGRCTSGTYNGVWATSSGQCAGGTFSSSNWAGHAYANPAMTCYLSTMNGPPDGSGSVLAFDSNACYNAPAPPPTNVIMVPNVNLL